MSNLAAERCERRGRRVARLFRKIRNLSDDVRACDLDAILRADQIDVSETWCTEPPYTACLVRPNHDCPPGIMLAPGQPRGRRRFSIAHELGHLYIPTHDTRLEPWCGDHAMTASAQFGESLEWEANDFAAELLMPGRLFRRDASQQVPSFSAASALADPSCYDVSITAAALRYVELTSERCALISSRRGEIEWIARSESFVYRIPWRGDALPSTSIAALGSNEGVPQPQALDPYTWLELKQNNLVEVFESTHVVPTQDLVLSLVWVVEGSEWD